jgi:hypothetical protein
MQCGGALAGREQQFERLRERYFDSLPTTLRYRGSLKSMLRNRLQLAYRNLKDTTPSLP